MFPTLPAPSSNSKQYRKISFNEIQLRKAKGLCFNCDEKFSPSHRFANRRLLLLQWAEEPPDSIDPVDVDFVGKIETPTVSKETTPKLSLNAMNSTFLSGTIRFAGSI